MLKKLSSNMPALLVLLVITLPLLGIFGYISFCQLLDSCINRPDIIVEEGHTALAETQTAITQEATAQAATATAQAATATAQDATAIAIPATQTAIAQEQTPTILANERSPTIKAIFDRGYIIAGAKCDFYPMGFIQDSNGNRVDCEFRDYESDERAGFEIEIVKEFAKRWLGDKSAVEFKTVRNPEDNIDKLTGGEVDLVAAVMTHTKERDEKISFSQTYFDDGQGLLVRDPNIKSLKDLDGKSVAVLLGTTSSNNIKTEAERLDVSIKVVPVTDDDGVKLLLNNQVDAYTTDSVRLIHLSEQNPPLLFVKKQSGEGPYRFSKEPYGMGVSKSDAEFRDLVNFTLQEMKSDGTYDRIYTKWFSDGFIYELETLPGKSYLPVNLTSMQRIEAGEFGLGIKGSDTERAVSLEAFSIDQYEVTNRLYKQCVDDGMCQVPQNREPYANLDNANHPVTWITVEQAKDYCAYVGKQLPTEDQWEVAARGSDQLIYPWGDNEPTPDQANFNHPEEGTMEVIWDKSDHKQHVSPYGLHHMAGNVREWVQSPQPDQEVTRGGGWKDTAEDIRTTKRFVGVNMVADDVGFRCAVEADEFPSPLP